MITFESLSKRIFQFFDEIYKENAIDYGFSNLKNERYREQAFNNNIRANVSTILFYRIDDFMTGNGIQSNSISYDVNNLEIISAIKDVDVFVDILSKKYLAKDSINFFNFAIQSERKNNACYNKNFDFDLILYSTSSNNPINLTELEKGAWTERLQFTLKFKYLDNLKLDEVQNLQNVDSFEEVKNVYKYTTKIKEK